MSSWGLLFSKDIISPVPYAGRRHQFKLNGSVVYSNNSTIHTVNYGGGEKKEELQESNSGSGVIEWREHTHQLPCVYFSSFTIPHHHRLRKNDDVRHFFHNAVSMWLELKFYISFFSFWRGSLSLRHHLSNPGSQQIPLFSYTGYFFLASYLFFSYVCESQPDRGGEITKRFILVFILTFWQGYIIKHIIG